MNDLKNKIQRLLEQHRFDESAHTLGEFLHTDEFLEEEAGKAHLTLLTAYMTALVRARQEYNQALDVGLALLKAAKNREHEMKDGIDSSATRGRDKSTAGVAVCSLRVLEAIHEFPYLLRIYSFK